MAVRTIGYWIIKNIDIIENNHLSVDLVLYIYIENLENIKKKGHIKIPLLSPSTGKPFVDLTVSEKDGKPDISYKLVNKLEKSLYDSFRVESIDQHKNMVFISLTTTIRISDFFTIEKRNDSYIIKLKFPACILPLYFKDMDEIIQSIENSRNPESFHMSIEISGLSWKNIPFGVQFDGSKIGKEFLESINNEVILEPLYIKLNQKNKTIKSDLMLNTGRSAQVYIDGLINIYYDKKEESMIAEFLIDKLTLHVDMNDKYTYIEFEEYSFLILDLFPVEYIFDKLISSEKLKIPIRDYDTAKKYGLYIIDWLKMFGKAILTPRH